MSLGRRRRTGGKGGGGRGRRRRRRKKLVRFVRERCSFPTEWGGRVKLFVGGSCRNHPKSL
jgi:hypothetical protein